MGKVTLLFFPRQLCANEPAPSNEKDFLGNSGLTFLSQWHPEPPWLK